MLLQFALRVVESFALLAVLAPCLESYMGYFMFFSLRPSRGSRLRQHSHPPSLRTPFCMDIWDNRNFDLFTTCRMLRLFMYISSFFLHLFVCEGRGDATSGTLSVGVAEPDVDELLLLNALGPELE